MSEDFDFAKMSREAEAMLRAIPSHLWSPATKLLLGDGTIDDVDSEEGHYPEDTHPEVESCNMVELKESHQPHFWIPAFTEDDHTAPEFVCSGWPRKIIDIFEKS